MNQVEKYRQQYTILLSAFKSNHPDLTPPAPSWFRMWLERYDVDDIEVAIALAPTNLNSEYTGRAISSALRKQALDRAIPGGSHD